MSAPGNTLHRRAIDVVDRTCRDDLCERLDVHEAGAGCILRRREETARTRSRRFQSEPWLLCNGNALRDSALAATSRVEPRTFSMVLSAVENDYGSCCLRSLHRQLNSLHVHGHVTIMQFREQRVRAYLRAGSRLVSDPDLVLEQILDCLAERHTGPRARCGAPS